MPSVVTLQRLPCEFCDRSTTIPYTSEFCDSCTTIPHFCEFCNRSGTLQRLPVPYRTYPWKIVLEVTHKAKTQERRQHANSLTGTGTLTTLEIFPLQLGTQTQKLMDRSTYRANKVKLANIHCYEQLSVSCRVLRAAGPRGGPPEGCRRRFFAIYQVCTNIYRIYARKPCDQVRLNASRTLKSVYYP